MTQASILVFVVAYWITGYHTQGWADDAVWHFLLSTRQVQWSICCSCLPLCKSNSGDNSKANDITTGSEYQQRIRTVYIWRNSTDDDSHDQRENLSRVTQLVLEHRFEPRAQVKVQAFSTLPFSSSGFGRLSFTREKILSIQTLYKNQTFNISFSKYFDKRRNQPIIHSSLLGVLLGSSSRVKPPS